MKRILIITMLVSALYGCDKFGDTNVSPALLTQASTKALLTNSEQALSGLLLGNSAASRLAALYVQHLAEGPYPGPSLYNDRNLNFSGCTPVHCTTCKQSSTTIMRVLQQPMAMVPKTTRLRWPEY